MSRRIELVSALLACALGLIWLVYEVNALQSLWAIGLGVGGASHSPVQPIGVNGVGLYFAGMAVVMICVALGAYLHAVQRLLPGLLLLWVAAAIATIGIGAYVVAPWQFVPPQFSYLMQAGLYAWVTPLGVLAVVFAWVAAVAGLPIRREASPPVGATDAVPRRQRPKPLAGS